MFEYFLYFHLNLLVSYFLPDSSIPPIYPHLTLYTLRLTPAPYLSRHPVRRSFNEDGSPATIRTTAGALSPVPYSLPFYFHYPVPCAWCPVPAFESYSGATPLGSGSLRVHLWASRTRSDFIEQVGVVVQEFKQVGDRLQRFGLAALVARKCISPSPGKHCGFLLRQFKFFSNS